MAQGAGRPNLFLGVIRTGEKRANKVDRMLKSSIIWEFLQHVLASNKCNSVICRTQLQMQIIMLTLKAYNKIP